MLRLMIARLSRWGVVLGGLVLLLAACAPRVEETEIPTLAVLPTPSRTVVPTAIVPTPTTVILTRPPLTPSATHLTNTPSPTRTPTPVNLFIERVVSSDDVLLRADHALCLPQTATITAALRTDVPLDWVVVSWFFWGQPASRRVTMQRAAQTVDGAMVSSEWAGVLGPFERTGTVNYQVAAQNARGEQVVSETRTFEVIVCEAATATPTATPGVPPTNTPYIGEAQSVHTQDAAYNVAFETPLTVILAWSGGFPPYTLEVHRPQRGTVTGSGPVQRYVPPDGFTGEDRFTFRVVDALGQASLGTITLQVAGP